MKAISVVHGRAPVGASLSDQASLRLAQLQVLVGGGYIEAVQMPLHHVGFIDDDGKRKQYGINAFGTYLWYLARQVRGGITSQRVQASDYLAGPLVIVGPANPDGDETSVTDQFESWLAGQWSEYQQAVSRWVATLQQERVAGDAEAVTK